MSCQPCKCQYQGGCSFRSFLEHQALVDEFAEAHGNNPLQWSEAKYGSIRCTVCEWRKPIFQMVRCRRRHVQLPPMRPGSTAQANAEFSKTKQRAQKYTSQPRSEDQKLKMHNWKIHFFSSFCMSCCIYSHKALQTNCAHSKSNCRQLPEPWGRVYSDHQAYGRNEQHMRALLGGKVL